MIQKMELSSWHGLSGTVIGKFVGINVGSKAYTKKHVIQEFARQICESIDQTLCLFNVIKGTFLRQGLSGISVSVQHDKTTNSLNESYSVGVCQKYIFEPNTLKPQGEQIIKA